MNSVKLNSLVVFSHMKQAYSENSKCTSIRVYDIITKKKLLQQNTINSNCFRKSALYLMRTFSTIYPKFVKSSIWINIIRLRNKPSKSIIAGPGRAGSSRTSRAC